MREYATHNKAELLAKRHYRGVAERLDEEARRQEFEIIAVGGHEHEVPEFLGHLSNELGKRVAGTFSVHPTEDDVGTIRSRAEEVVERYERAEEQRLVAETFDRHAAGGLAVVGLRDCLWGAATAAIGQLLVQDGVVLPGAVCDVDGYLSVDGEQCPVCGRTLRRTPDVLDELVQAVIDEGGSVEHVAADTPLREHVAAATLRFPVPPPPVV
jgi:peptide chain release factor subunit 1